MKIQFLALLLLILSMMGCKKEEEKKTDLLSLLTSKAWKPNRNASFYWQICDYDDSYKFGRNQLTIVKGETKCPGYHQYGDSLEQIKLDIETVDYQIDLNNKILIYKGVTYEILEISETQLRLRFELPPAVGYWHGIRGFEH